MSHTISCRRLYQAGGGLIYSDRVFLFAPKKRQFDAFGESLRGKLQRLETRSDGLDDPGSQEREPSQAPDVI